MAQSPDLLSLDYNAEFDPLVQTRADPLATTNSTPVTRGPTQEQFQHVFGMREELRMWGVKSQDLKSRINRDTLQIEMIEESIQEIEDYLQSTDSSFQKFIQKSNQMITDCLMSGDAGQEHEVLQIQQQIDLASEERENIAQTQRKKTSQVRTLKSNISENEDELKVIETKTDRINHALTLAMSEYGMVRRLIPQPGEPTPPLPSTITVRRGKDARPTKPKPQIQSPSGSPTVPKKVIEHQVPSKDLLAPLSPQSNTSTGPEHRATFGASAGKVSTAQQIAEDKQSVLECEYAEAQRVAMRQQAQINEMANELVQLRERAEEAQKLAEELAFSSVPKELVTSTPNLREATGGNPPDPDPSDSDEEEVGKPWTPYHNVPSQHPRTQREVANGPPGGNSGPLQPPYPGRNVNPVTSITHHRDGNITYHFQEEPANINVTVPSIPTLSAIGQGNRDLERIAKEFRKSRDPKVVKFKGGSTSDAMLRLNRWLMDLDAVKMDKGYTDVEMIRVATDSVEDHAEQELLFYLETNRPNATYQGLINHMKTAFCCCEDPLLMQADFYGREQRKGESVDKFASALQILSRKLLFLEPTYTQVQIDEQLKKQFANHLADNLLKITAKTLLSSQPGLSWPEYRKQFVLLTDTRGRGKIITSQAVQKDDDDDDNSTSVVSKNTKKRKPKKIKSRSGNQTTTTALAQETNPSASGSGLSKDVQALVAALTQMNKGASPSHTPTTPSDTTPQRQGRPYLGKRPMNGPPKEVQGVDGTMDPTKFCRYCKQKGHWVQPGDNCPNLKAHKEKLAARAAGPGPQQLQNQAEN